MIKIKPMENNTIESKLKELTKVMPFKWRVQSAIPKNAPTQVMMIAYVDARDVAEHLDEIIGAASWCDKYEEINGVLFCSIGILINGNWVFKSDCGTKSHTEPEKGAASDAFKRAAVKWGINRAAYEVGIVKLPAKMYMNKPYPADDNGNFLKGDKLIEACNKLAKVEELDGYDIEISDKYLNEYKIAQDE